MENWERRRYKEKFGFNYKANKLYLELLEDTEYELMSHVVVAQHIWLQRLIKRAPKYNLGDPINFEKIKLIDAENLASILSAISVLPLTKEITYKNSKGLEYTNTFAEIMDHLLMHAQYHRGQISIKLREQGKQIPVTDMISYFRSQTLKG
jgi:uncharacterized damage-inducible protein DinB